MSEDCCEDSHIIPAFVFRYLKKTSITGHMRTCDEPNRRLTDGPKPKLLGPACEDLFSKWEGQFASEVFYPLHDGDLGRRVFHYGDWLAKFAVSVSWRTLKYLMDKNAGESVPHGQTPLLQPTLDVWADFLLNRRKDIGCHRQHMMFLDNSFELPGVLDQDFFSIYVHRSVDHTTMHAPDEAYVFTKMAQILIIGTIFTRKPSVWQRTHIHVSGGSYGPGLFRASGCVWTFFETAYRSWRSGLSNISPKQSAKVSADVRRKLGLPPQNT